jgi:hypothetical protein
MNVYEDSDVEDYYNWTRRRPSKNRFLFWRLLFCLFIGAAVVFGIASIFCI